MCAVGPSPGMPLANALGHGVLGGFPPALPRSLPCRTPRRPKAPRLPPAWRFEPFQGRCGVRAAPVADDGVAPVGDDRPGAGGPLPPRFAGRQDVERFGGGDEDTGGGVMREWRPPRTSGHAFTWQGVGAANPASNRARTAGWRSARSGIAAPCAPSAGRSNPAREPAADSPGGNRPEAPRPEAPRGRAPTDPSGRGPG